MNSPSFLFLPSNIISQTIARVYFQIRLEFALFEHSITQMFIFLYNSIYSSCFIYFLVFALFEQDKMLRLIFLNYSV